jgi:diguanylate cyclase (GGDEF)-like protein/PAS domain S-box-containing protein
MDDRALLQALLDSPSRHAIMVTNLDGAILLWNHGAERIFGYSTEEIVGTSAERLFEPDDRKEGVPHKEMATASKDGCAGDFRWHVRKDGTAFWADGMMYPVRLDGADIGYMKILRDATAQKLREDEHERMAFVDALTGLPNRAEFDRRLVDMIGSAQRHGELLILQLVDIDHFKEVNDSLGHPAGDALLVEVAHRMHGLLRTTDHLARLGGDEFAILQPGGHSLDAAIVVARKLLECLALPVDVAGSQAHVSASIGISAYPTDAMQMEHLMRNADIALYQAKAAGRNRYKVYEARQKRRSV